MEGIPVRQWAEVPQQLVTVKITLGQLRVSLVPTTDAQRPVNYVVKFNSDGRTQFIENWSVPPSAVPLRLKDVRSGPVAGPVTTGSASITDVIGLRSELDVRPAKGSAFRSSRAAVINTSGALDAALGNPSDCVRVDGTSGPCGVSSPVIFVDAEMPSGAMDGSNLRIHVVGRAGEPWQPASFPQRDAVEAGSGLYARRCCRHNGTIVTTDCGRQHTSFLSLGIRRNRHDSIRRK